MRRRGPVPRDLREMVRRELEPGETVTWMEMPVPKFFTQMSTAAFLFGIPWTAFAFFWTFGAAGFKIPDFSKGIGAFDFFPLFGLPFILIGFGMLLSPIWTYRKALKTVYAITDRRAITFKGGRSTTIRSYPPSALKNIYRKQRKGGTGDVIIPRKDWNDSDSNRPTEEPGFLRVRDARRVEQMLRDLASREQPALSDF
ncbi:hypothetical protein ACFL2Q_10035 [Thermodesulfobacteriota bacterium]